ncbi:MAG: NUDIX hydrolase N-terminal domain-containing protein [Saprospiraceae bacterium]|nr:NUDIX hydrolase N-terminal domain-containing protein [Saprospiraceae bacterium]MCB9318895.1 NUDIX hydrolase N-terminal domain-containing protein [Lewinellaceae bacterium]
MQASLKTAQHPFFEYLKRVRAIAHIGLVYAENDYQKERNQEIIDLTQEMVQQLTDIPMKQIKGYFAAPTEYITPKVDVRAVVFDPDGRLLMVREKADGMWALPGGWADIGLSPSECAVKETFEETGFTVEPKKLLAAVDAKYFNHPPQPHAIYKLFIECYLTGGEAQITHDILEVGFFDLHEMPPLSLERNSQDQIDLVFAYRDNPDKLVTFN